MPTEVSIKTGARLHFGPLANAAPQGRDFGGLGLMIESPGVELSLRSSSEDKIVASGECCERVGAILRQLRSGTDFTSSGYDVRVKRSIPQHAGFGAGTQLSLAIAKAVSILADRELSVLELAKATGRGLRSSLGIHGFEHGGLLVDGGKSSRSAIGALAARREFPVDWPILLVTPPIQRGLSGESERQAFADLRPMTLDESAWLCQNVLMKILPAVSERNFEEFANSLNSFGDAVGSYFSPAQGGVFSSQPMSQLAAELHEQGIHGIAQTSWGPTIAVFVESEANGRNLQQQLKDDTTWSNCETCLTVARNNGVTVTLNDS